MKFGFKVGDTTFGINSLHLLSCKLVVVNTTRFVQVLKKKKNDEKKRKNKG